MSPADKGPQSPERGSAPVEDPAIAAGKKLEEAAAALLAIPADTYADEQKREYKAALKREKEADDAFSAAPVTSVAGALVKLRALAKDITEDSRTDAWELGHVKTVTAFLEGVDCAPSVVGDDPAVVALAEFKIAKAADDAISDKDAEVETPEYKATGDRLYAARDVVYDAVPTSMAGMAAKIRFLFDHGERGNDLWPLFNIMAKSMLPFLEGGAAAVPDPVVIMSAEWGAIYDEMTALSAANPDNKSGELMDRWEAALERVRALEDQILKTPASSMAGVVIKLRIATDRTCDSSNLGTLHAVPAREIDYKEQFGGDEWTSEFIISALIDAERLAAVS